MGEETIKPTTTQGTIEIKITVYYTKCPVCGRKIYGLHDGEVRRALVEHLNEKHG
jgi:hypothetical protein